MRTASYLGLLAMVGIAVFAFLLFDEWWSAANELLDRWRKHGIVRNESLGEYLDETARRVS